MQERLFQIIKDAIGSEFQRVPMGVYNIYPQHVPDGAIDNTFTSALVYNVVSNQVNYTLNFYTVQLTVFNNNFAECRRIAVLVKDLFNKKNFVGDTDGFIVTDCSDMQQLDFDTETGIYGVAVNITIKTTRAW